MKQIGFANRISRVLKKVYSISNEFYFNRVLIPDFVIKILNIEN